MNAPARAPFPPRPPRAGPPARRRPAAARPRLAAGGLVPCGDRAREGLSRERARQIVAQALGGGRNESKLDHAWAQIARLEPALRLAARGVVDGELGAVDRLLRGLDRLDEYSAIEGADRPCDENARERPLAKLNSMAERMLRPREAGVVGPDGRAVPPEAESALDAPNSLDFAEQSSTSSRRTLDVA